jgi:hypothetical protein
VPAEAAAPNRAPAITMGAIAFFNMVDLLLEGDCPGQHGNEIFGNIGENVRIRLTGPG